MQKILIVFGNFIFRWRDTIFTLIFLPPFYLVTLPQMTAGGLNADNNAFTAGMIVTGLGLFIRMLTIGFGFIMRSGVDKQIHASGIMRVGFFAHTRNPLYVGNYLIVTGVMISINLTFYYIFLLPLFYIIYYAITIAEEEYLKKKFGKEYETYLKEVNRYIPGNLSSFKDSFKDLEFSWKRYFKREYSSTALALMALSMIQVVKLHGQYDYPLNSGLPLFLILFTGVLFGIYILIRVLAKAKFLEITNPEPKH